MGDILSQSEIDELLNALSSGKTGDVVLNASSKTPIAKDYNFAKPSKFNKEQLRTLEIIFDNFARLVSSFLTGYLRTACSLEVASAEQITYKEFNNSIVNPVILGIIDFAPLKGSVVLELSSNIGYSVIDRILGGPGLSMKRIRDFSEIEKILLDRIISQMLNYLIEPFENVVALKPSLEKIETNSQFAQIISPNEMVVLITLTSKFGVSEGLMNFCIPHYVLEPIMERLYTKYWFTQAEASDNVTYREDLEAQLEKSKVPICAVIGKTSITVGDFIGLQVGDVIPLDSYVTTDLDVMVGNLLKFHAKPGIMRGKNAIQITSIVKKEEV